MNTRSAAFDDESAPPPSDDVLAGEYVLGVLDTDACRRVQARIAAEPRFALLVEAWQAGFTPWLLSAQPQTPSAHVWPRIRTRLGWPAVEAPRAGLWNNIGFWRTAAALAAAAGIAAIVLDLQRRPPPALPPAVVVQPPAPPSRSSMPVTVLVRDDGSTAWLASYDPIEGLLRIVPVPTPLDATERVHELWVIAAGQSPRSLGQVSNDMTQVIAVPASLQPSLAVGSTLAITLEPPAGIPHTAPTGPIVANGSIVRI